MEIVEQRIEHRDFVELGSLAPSESIDEIRSLLKRDGMPDNEAAAKRVLKFRINRDSVDRYGSVLNINGWETDNYRSNPVFLYQHQRDCMADSVMMPAGRSIKEWSVLPAYDPAPEGVRQFVRSTPINGEDGTGLFQLVFFPDVKESEAVRSAYEMKLLNAVSPGFKVMEKLVPADLKNADTIKKYGLDEKNIPKLAFKSFLSIRQELFESSAVTLPGNVDAKQVRSAIDAGFREEFLDVLKLNIGERFGNIRQAVETINRSVLLIEQFEARFTAITDTQERILKELSALREVKNPETKNDVSKDDGLTKLAERLAEFNKTLK